MKITIDRNFYIDVNVSTYDLIETVPERESKNKDGETVIIKTYEKDHGYHATLEQAIKRFVRINMIEEHDFVTLKQYIDLYKEEVNRIEKLVKLEVSNEI